MSSEQQRKKPQTKQQRAAAKKKKQRNKIILLCVEILVVVILAVVFFGMSKLNKIERNTEIMQDVEVNEDLSSETLDAMDNYRTVVVFGLDNRSNGRFSSGNSDVIILVTINNDTHEVKMCSVYRDTYLDIGGGKFRKCNAAFANGGPEAAISMLNKNLDLNITDYVTVDFNAVVECIDLLGGVEMTITDQEAHLMIGYMEEINGLTDHNSKVPECGGTYLLDGVQATAYARIRQTAGDDYKRTERQRAVIMEMVKKAQSSDLATINSIIDEVFDDIETSFSNADLISLAAQVFNYQIVGSTGFPFVKDSVNLGNKGSVVAPCTLESNVIELHKYLYDDEEYTPSTTVQANSKKVEADTGFGEGDGF